MASLSEIIQLCRLCLVKDDVNIPIFDDFDSIRQIPLKISSCLPVKVARGDNLPKKICDRCSSKLDLCYNFWNSTAQVEKTLLSMVEKQNQVPEAAIPEPLILKVEPAESLEDTHSQICEPPVPNPISVKAEVEATADSIENEAEQPLAKRPRRSAAIKAQTQITPESDDDAAETTTEDVAEMEDGIDDPDVPDMSVDIDDVKPGPSGLNQGSTDSEWAELDMIDNETSVIIKEEPMYQSIEYSCLRCNLDFCDVEEVKRHVHQEGCRYNCSFCCQIFDTKVAVISHGKKHHNYNGYTFEDTCDFDELKSHHKTFVNRQFTVNLSKSVKQLINSEKCFEVGSFTDSNEQNDAKTQKAAAHQMHLETLSFGDTKNGRNFCHVADHDEGGHWSPGRSASNSLYT